MVKRNPPSYDKTPKLFDGVLYKKSLICKVSHRIVHCSLCCLKSKFRVVLVLLFLV